MSGKSLSTYTNQGISLGRRRLTTAMDPMKDQKNKAKITSRKNERGHEFPVLERSTASSNWPQAPFRLDEAGDFRELTAANSYQITSSKKEEKFSKKRKVHKAEVAAGRSGISQAEITTRKEELDREEIRVTERSASSSKRPLAPSRSDKVLKTRRIQEDEEDARGSGISKEVRLSKKKREKSRKALSYIHEHFKLSPPYKVLVDGAFVLEAVNGGMWAQDEMRNRLAIFLGGGVQIFTTTCVREELHIDMDKSNLHRQSLSLAASLETISCCHEKSGAESCIRGIIGTRNTGHYFVATNLLRLGKKLLQIPATPIIYILHHELVLHPVSGLQKKFVASKKRMHEQRRPRELVWGIEMEEMEVMEEKARAGTSSGANEQKKKKKLSNEERERLKDRPRFRREKVAKGPNPLSCLKKKKKVPVQKQAGTASSSEQNEKEVPVLEKPAGDDPEAPNADQKIAKLSESTTLESAKRKRKRKSQEEEA